MNIYESIYLIQMNDFYEMNHLIQYYRPMVTEIWADIFVRKIQYYVKEMSFTDMQTYCCIDVFLNIVWIVY